jgi:hypothetical protein
LNFWSCSKPDSILAVHNVHSVLYQRVMPGYKALLEPLTLFPARALQTRWRTWPLYNGLRVTGVWTPVIWSGQETTRRFPPYVWQPELYGRCRDFLDVLFPTQVNWIFSENGNEAFDPQNMEGDLRVFLNFKSLWRFHY